MTATPHETLLAGFSKALEEQRLHDGLSAQGRARDGGLTRVEALVRWDDPELGPVEPSRFVPLGRGAWADRRSHPLGTCGRSFASGSIGATTGSTPCIAFNISALSLAAPRFPRPGRADVPGARCADRPAGARADRGRDPTAGQADGHADPLPDQGHRPCDRRFRHRLFVADAASPAALHRGQDRSGVRRRRRRARATAG